LSVDPAPGANGSYLEFKIELPANTYCMDELLLFLISHRYLKILYWEELMEFQPTYSLHKQVPFCGNELADNLVLINSPLSYIGMSSPVFPE
jgi:hypothetical protein